MSTEEKKKLEVHIRWMIRRDIPEILGIETSSFEYPWQEDDFVRCLRQRNCIGMVAEYRDRIVGFFIYELHKTRLNILNFAVHPDYRHNGIGSQMVNKLTDKLSHQKRTRILLEISERNLPAQMFFRALGFRAISVLKNHYHEENTDEDAYLMEYRYQSTIDEVMAGWGEGENRWSPVNRITRKFAS